VNENKKGMLMKITNALAEFNVVKQQNDSRDDIAYNLVRASLVVQVDTTAWTTVSTGVNRNRQDHVELSYSFVGICFFYFYCFFSCCPPLTMRTIDLVQVDLDDMPDNLDELMATLTSLDGVLSARFIVSADGDNSRYKLNRDASLL